MSEERLRFVIAASRQEKSVSELAAEFGISRQTGHTWLQRYRAEGSAGVLAERSRAPHSQARTVTPEAAAAVVELRKRYPDWGARKLRQLLLREHPGLIVSVSSTHRIVSRQELIRQTDRHPPALKRFEREEPNELWQMDFKGPKGFRQRSGPPVGDG